MNLTKRTALEACVKGWTEMLALRPEAFPPDIDGLKWRTSLEKYGSYCPCCHYDRQFRGACFCESCPMNSEWHNSLGCTGRGSPYREAREATNLRRYRAACRKMIEAAQRCLDALPTRRTNARKANDVAPGSKN
jgi:hypothetical protein